MVKSGAAAEDRGVDLAQPRALARAPVRGAQQLAHAAQLGILREVRHRVHALTVELDDIVRGSVDRAFLTTFGRFWADRAEPLHLVEPDKWHAALATAATPGIPRTAWA